MAKKSSTIHVEEFVWKEIERIQKEQDISSRNTAIEYLIAEYRGLKNKPLKTNLEATEDKIEEVKPEVKKEEKVLDPMIEKLKQQEDDMPD